MSNALTLGTCTIMRNDPVVLISGELVAELQDGNLAPYVTLNDDILTIDAVNRRVVYRIDWDSYDPLCHNYRMQWPD